MTKLRNGLLLAVALMFAAPSAAHAQLTYVGSWVLGNGPVWNTGPTPYTGQEAAALLFGGSPASYVISVTGTNPGSASHTAWYDVYGYGPSLHAENYASNNAGPGYDTPGDASAYICDNTYIGGGNYCSPNGGDPQYTNYAFEVTATPEPASMVLMGTGLVGIVGFARRRRRTA